MIALALLLMILAALVIIWVVAASSNTPTNQLSFAGIDVSMNSLAMFLLGLGTALAALLGLYLFLKGSKRGARKRKERKELEKHAERAERERDDARLAHEREHRHQPAGVAPGHGRDHDVHRDERPMAGGHDRDHRRDDRDLRRDDRRVDDGYDHRDERPMAGGHDRDHRRDDHDLRRDDRDLRRDDRRVDDGFGRRDEGMPSQERAGTYDDGRGTDRRGGATPHSGGPQERVVEEYETDKRGKPKR